MSLLNNDRLFPADPVMRGIARQLYAEVRDLPIISPHGHTQAAWFAKNEPFPDPAKLFVQPDHYIFRMLYSQGISLEDLEIGVGGAEGSAARVAHLRRELLSVPRHADAHVAGLRVSGAVWPGGAAVRSDRRSVLRRDLRAAAARRSSCRARCTIASIIEVLATTDSPLDSLADHQAIRDSGWKARIMPTFRPDSVVDPDFTGFQENVAKLGEQTRARTPATWQGYLTALR